MNSTIIYKYLSGLTTEEENRELLVWLNASAENKAEFFDIKALWNAQSLLVEDDAESVDASLSCLNRRIDAFSGKDSMPAGSRRRMIIRLMSAAAIFLVLLVGAYFVVDRGLNLRFEAADTVTVYTNSIAGDSVKIVCLPDGTTVWLSSNTTLTCPNELGDGLRVVYLSGEAFFEVKSDPEHPFIVKTEAYDVRVLGTSFSVDSRPSEEMTETVLMSGSVQIEEPNGKSLATLRPGQQALFEKDTKKMQIRTVDANALTSWRFGLISLTEVTIQEILDCLEDTYSVKIKMNASQIKDRSYNFSFKRSKGVRSALDQLSFITGISTEILPE